MNEQLTRRVTVTRVHLDLDDWPPIPPRRPHPWFPFITYQPGRPKLPSVEKVMMRQKLTTVREFQDEARMDTILLTLFRGLYSAVWNPGVLYRRYKRHCEFFGIMTGWQNWAILAICLLLSTVTAVVGYGYDAANVETRSMGTNPIQTGILAFVAIMFISGLVSVLIRLQMIWSMTYASVWIFESADPVDEWRTTSVIQTYLPRLAFVDTSEGDFFSGPTRASGPRKGRVHLQLPVGVKVTALRHIRECYTLPPSSSTFTEVTARETFDMIERTVQTGALVGAAGKSRLGKLLNEQWPWIVTVLSLMLMFFMSGAGQGNTTGF